MRVTKNKETFEATLVHDLFRPVFETDANGFPRIVDVFRDKDGDMVYFGTCVQLDSGHQIYAQADQIELPDQIPA